MHAVPMLTNEDWLNIEKELYSRSLSEFVKGAWHVLEPSQKYIHGWHVDAICDHLEAVTRGEITRLLINVPPGTMKSTLVSIMWPAWEWGPKNMPGMRIISASHEQGLAVRDTLKMRRLVTSDWFQARWPINMTGDQNAKTYYENEHTGFRQACAMASMTGRRGDRVILDDPHSVEAALSEANRTTDLREFRETVPTRLNNPDRSAIVVVMQRLHEEDVSGYILDNDLGYEKLILPMEYEADRKCSTSIGFVDPRKEDGELLFPERFPREVIDRDKKIMGNHAIAGQFQQRPTPRGGNILKGEWFRRYTVIPRIKYRMIFADTAQKTKEANDYSVFECWGLSMDGNLYLLDLIRGKWEAVELENRAKSFWAKHKEMNPSELGALRKMIVEDKSSGTSLIQRLRSESNVLVDGLEREKDKYTRMLDVVAYIEAGRVYVPEYGTWVDDFIREAEAFSANDTHKNDDQLDPMIDAIDEMLDKNAVNVWSKLGKK